MKRVLDVLLSHSFQLKCNLDGRGTSKVGLRGPLLDLVYGESGVLSLAICTAVHWQRRASKIS